MSGCSSSQITRATPEGGPDGFHVVRIATSLVACLPAFASPDFRQGCAVLPGRTMTGGFLGRQQEFGRLHSWMSLSSEPAPPAGHGSQVVRGTRTRLIEAFKLVELQCEPEAMARDAVMKGHW